MDARLEALLDELRQDGVAFDATRDDRTERRRNLEPDSARLLHLLVLATGAKRVLELGTSNGYSTIWLADAVRANGGRLLSVDIDAERQEAAAANLERAGLATAAQPRLAETAGSGLAQTVELRLEDAADTLRASDPAGWDLIFLDAERPAYTAYWSDLVRALRPAGLLAVDNVLSHADEVADFRTLVTADRRVTEALSPTGAGLLLITRLP
jgi:predicted O-methyltransferase YrrM